MKIFNSLSLLCTACFILSDCKHEQENTSPADSVMLSSEADRFFSTPLTKDHFAIQVQGSDLLTGTTQLEITASDGHTIFEHAWPVSDFFSIADNHYLDKAEKENMIRGTIAHCLDESNFNLVTSMQFNSLWQSSDELFWKDIIQDSTSIGFSYIKEDRCIAYSKKYKKTITFRALKVNHR